MKPSNNEEGNSEKSSSSDSGSKKTFTNKTSDTSGLLNSKRTPSGRIALDFSNKRSIDVSNIVNDSNVDTVEYTNEEGTFASYETGAPFRTKIRSAVSGGSVTMIVNYKDGTNKVYTF